MSDQAPKLKKNDIEYLKQKTQTLNSKIFENGFETLLENNEIPEAEPYIVLVFNCPKRFFEKYNRRIHAKLKIENAYTAISQSEENEEVFNMVVEDKEIPRAQLKDNDFTLSSYTKFAIENTKFYVELIRGTFDGLNKYEKQILSNLIEERCIHSSQNLQKNENYVMFNTPSNRAALDDKKDYYYELHYEDYVIVLLKFLKYLSYEVTASCKKKNGQFDVEIDFDSSVEFTESLTIKVDFDVSGLLLVKFYASEQYYKNLAEHFNYYLQLKPYGRIYNKFFTKIKNDKQLIDEEGTLEILKEYKESPYQFHDLDESDVNNYPPHVIFDNVKETKHRRYLRGDIYDNDIQHIYEIDQEYIKEIEGKEGKNNNDKEGKLEVKAAPTIFRNIDKLRLISYFLDQRLNYQSLKKNEYLTDILYQRDFDGNKEDFQPKELFLHGMNVFNLKKQEELIHNVRNFYGEDIGFYFHFLNSLTIWMLFPAFIGILVAGLNYYKPIENKMFNDDTSYLRYVDLMAFLYSFLITVWSLCFLNVWRQKEQFYTYVWGMEDYEATEPQLETFKPDDRTRVLVNNYEMTYSRWKRLLKKILCYAVILIMIALTLFILVILFKWKGQKMRENALNKTTNWWPQIIGMLNAVQIKIMSAVYSKIIVAFNDWENYEKQSQYDSSLIVKVILFEFINNYSSLFYIAFFKRDFEGCVNNDCEKELRTQTYMILITIFSLNFVEVGIPYSLNWLKKKLYLRGLYITEEEKKDLTFEPHTLRQQLIAPTYGGYIDEYNEIVLMFGYVVFFSIMCPLAPLIVCGLLITEKIVDTYKIFFLLKVNTVSGCKGIGVYNSIFTIFYFLGMIFGICTIIFTRTYLNKTEFWIKILILLAFESVLLVSIYFFNWNILPNWFSNKESLCDKFKGDYYNPDDRELPHTRFLKSYENEYANDEDNDPIKQIELNEEFDEDKDKNVVYFKKTDEGYDSFDESNGNLNKFGRVRKQFKPIDS